MNVYIGIVNCLDNAYHRAASIVRFHVEASKMASQIGREIFRVSAMQARGLWHHTSRSADCC
uniref:Uncharacterized protein n=1 Tax=Anopheles minimus TaxID=112268 RepID=A0A182WND7_9DIPT